MSTSRLPIPPYGAAVEGVRGRFAPDATVSFVGVPVGPFAGRVAIAEAYRTSPPTETMHVVASESYADEEVSRFRWSGGGSGTMRLTWSGALLQTLVVEFDP